MFSLRSLNFRFSALTVLLAGSLAALGCGSSTSSGPTGGPVTGALDTHCKNADGTQKIQKVGMCVTGAALTAADADVDSSTADSGEEAGADAGDDAGEGDDGGGGGSDFGETLFNSEGNDDDCKYHVKFTVTPVRKGDGSTFTVTVTRLDNGKPATGAQEIDAEVFLTDTPTHQAPSLGTAKESGSGTGIYVFGPIKFDMSGRWTVRFHLFGNCNDTEDSPHGHAAFYIDVP